MPDIGLLNVSRANAILHFLVENGCTHTVYSPGSRNAPFAIALHKNQNLKTHIIIDERSASFFALGLAKSSGKPVALFCTSGTAAANYYPAIIEAAESRIPLFVVSSDRPADLVGIGSPQTIDQSGIFGNFAHYVALDLPKYPQDISVSDYLKKQLSQQVYSVIHINQRFDKPLEPDESKLTEMDFYGSGYSIISSKTRNIEPLSETIKNLILTSKRPLIIAGPVAIPLNYDTTPFLVSQKMKAPLLAEALSQPFHYSTDYRITPFEPIVRFALKSNVLKPDLILRFNRQPTSAAIERYLSHNTEIPHFHFDLDGSHHDATQTTDSHFTGKFDWSFLDNYPAHNTFYQQWHNFNSEDISRNYNYSNTLTDGSLFSQISDLISNEDQIMLSNSFPVRDWDLFCAESRPHSLYCNRGVNGIDGTIATAFGIATHQPDRRTLLITGDVTFAHDAASLQLANLSKAFITIIVINNGGGTIFDMLPVSRYDSTFRDRFFRTKPDINLHNFSESMGFNYLKIENINELKKLKRELLFPSQNLIIECITDAEVSMNQRKRIWSSLNHD